MAHLVINKKLIITGLVLLLSALFYFLNPFAGFSGYMRGSVVEVKSNSIVVTGVVVQSPDPQEPGREEDRTIEFEISPKTVLKNKAIVITQENIESGRSFQPKTEERPGTVSDLAKGVGIISIKSKDNLFKAEKAAASEIIYSSYDFPEQ